MSLQTKEFGAKIPKELYDEFRHLFPMYGATTWFINETLKSFLDHVRDDDILQRAVELSIEEMLRENRENAKDSEGNSRELDESLTVK